MSLLTSSEVLQEFHTQLINFCDELIEQFPGEGDLIIFRHLLNHRTISKELIDTFNAKMINNDCKLKNMVSARNDAFFIENDIFDSIYNASNLMGRPNIFKRIWASGLDQDVKTTIWKWFDSLIKIGNRYMTLIKKESQKDLSE